MRLARHTLLAVSAAVALTTTALAAQPPREPIGGPPHAGPPEANPAELQALQRAAATAQRNFSADPGARLAVSRAIKAHDEETVKAILIHEGFTSEQASGAAILIQDHTGGGQPTEKVKVTVSVSCCPVKITVTLSF